jgi:hypothetical protein
MKRPMLDRQPHPLLVATNELLTLLAEARAQIVRIKSELERQVVPAPSPTLPVFVCDDPTLEVELHERITAAGIICARAYGYRYKTRGGFPQVAARLRAELGIQRLIDLRIAQWSQALAALRRIEQHARQRILDMSSAGGHPAALIKDVVRADVADMPQHDAAGRPSAEPVLEPTPPREVP